MRKLLVILWLCLITTSAFGQFQQKPMLGIQVDGASPSSKGLVGALLFNEGSGNIVSDLSGNGQIGNFIGNPTWGAGNFGSALTVDGINNHVKVNSALVRTEPLTLIVWLNQVGDAGALEAYLSLGSSDPTSGDTYFYIGIDTAGGLHEMMGHKRDGVSNDNVTFKSTSLITDGVWYMGAAVFETSTLRKLYFNGVLENTNTTSIIHTASLVDRTSIGCVYSKDVAAVGTNSIISHAMIYNRALSASEIAELYREPFAMFVKDDIALLASAEAPPGVVVTPYYYRGLIPLPLIFFVGYCYLRGQKCVA